MPDGERMTSSRQPIYIWRDFMERALRGTPTTSDIPVPEGISFASFDRTTGNPGGSTRGAFLAGTEPTGSQTTTQAVRITIPIDNRTGSRATASTPRNNIVWQEIAPNEIERYVNN
jgi:membrane carboxypeptidase/penicillin-binding protein